MTSTIMPAQTLLAITAFHAAGGLGGRVIDVNIGC